MVTRPFCTVGSYLMAAAVPQAPYIRPKIAGVKNAVSSWIKLIVTCTRGAAEPDIAAIGPRWSRRRTWSADQAGGPAIRSSDRGAGKAVTTELPDWFARTGSTARSKAIARTGPLADAVVAHDHFS
jgi:hypothetical protein